MTRTVRLNGTKHISCVANGKKNTEDFSIEQKSINTIRIMAADMVQRANSGHPGAPMGCAPMAYNLFLKFMDYSPRNPKWIARDRYVQSNGHACALLYTMLHLTGYNISLDDLKNFRATGSITPGHPENFATPGVEVSTGPLGQGISSAVGLAMGEQHLAAVYNEPGFELFNNFTYVICGDGCLQEGISSEASSLAGHLKLGKLIVLYDDNQITIDGDTSLSFTEDVLKRYESYGWHTQYVSDGTDVSAIQSAILKAKNVVDKPSLIKVRTVIGYGSSNEGSEKTHGAALGESDVRQVKEKFGFDPEDSFHIPSDVLELFRNAGINGDIKETKWQLLFQQYKISFPSKYNELMRRFENRLPDGWKDDLPYFDSLESGKATRIHSGNILNKLALRMPEIVGGSADLTHSNNVWLKCSSDYTHENRRGRYIRFGVREHAMAAICNGLFAYGGFRPYGATFLNFISYALGSVRVSALSRYGIVYIMSHDSIGLGEDGPTHQPVETLENLRSIPNIHVIRPADGNETTGAYISAVESTTTPTVLALTRQTVPNLEGTSIEGVMKGAYKLCEHGGGSILNLILIASGSEVQLVVGVAKKLAQKNKKVRVVSMPCQEIYDEQNDEYKVSLFPDGIPVMSVEASSTHGWHKYAHAPFGITRFGCSGPSSQLFCKFGFTIENLVVQAEKVMKFYSKGNAPSLLRPTLDLLGYQ